MLDINLMLKDEILDRYNFRCTHRHNGMPGGHPNCYAKARDKKERIGFLDIETGIAFDAQWGFVICWRLKELDGEIMGDTIRPAEIRANLRKGATRDKRILESFCKAVWNFDTLIVYYGKDSGIRQRHDIPFLRTRCAKWGVKGFPEWKQIKVIDAYDIVRGKFKLHRNRMLDACNLLGIKSKGSPFDTDTWLDAYTGHKDAIEYIGKHCDEDVVSTEMLWKAVNQYKGTRTKI